MAPMSLAESGDSKASALVIDVSQKGRISIGNVEVPQDAFMAILKVDD
mgnify:CR=1 FL=1